MMELLDWGVLCIYFVILITLGFYWGRGQITEGDYYLAGRNMPYWAVGLSIMATQCSAIGLVSAPAFVALANNGGLRWLQYEFAVPLAMVLTAIIFVPVFYNSKVVSVYEYLEKRFDSSTQTLLSFMFLFGRGLATGCGVYLSAVVFSIADGLSLGLNILIIGGIAIVYTIIGGMKGVIYSDVLQLFLLWGSVFMCIGIIIHMIGIGDIFSAIPVDRAQAIDFSHTGFDGHTFAFWPMLIGGIFHYFSYYGCDQSQIQRVLSSESVDRAKSSLFLNGFLRFPLVLTYCVFGLCLIGFLEQTPQFAAEVAAQPSPDFLVPMFIINYVPAGLTGLFVAGLFAASMSSLDSAYNSLSASTISDFYIKYINKTPSHSQCIFWARVATLGWGLFTIGFAFIAGGISETIIEGINKIGSLFYGPILGAFLLGLLSKRTRGQGVIAGVIAEVCFSVYLWFFQPQVSWMWWNLIGCVITCVVGYSISLLFTKPKIELIEPYLLQNKKIGKPNLKYLILILYCIFIILLSYSFHLLF